jgi:MFS transporter, SP family, general alpha glucoside:H+ symporter
MSYDRLPRLSLSSTSSTRHSSPDNIELKAHIPSQYAPLLEDHEMLRQASCVEELSSDIDSPHSAKTTTHEASMPKSQLVFLSSEAKYAAEKECSMSLIQAVKLYPKAVAWSILLSSAVIMEGYDVVLLGSFYALPQFTEKYGVRVDGDSHEIPAGWKSGLSNGACFGEILGLFINGIVSEKFGYRKTMMISLFAMVCFIFIPFFSPNIETLLVGEILCGIPWGVFQTLTTTYASEVCPVALRAYLCTYVNLCWVIGQFIASGVIRAVLGRSDEWAYRIPFAVQWIWPLPILVGVYFAPESPWWLVRQGRDDDARKVVLRLTSKKDPTFDASETVAMMSQTNVLEKRISAGTSYWDCFTGIDLRRTEIACVCWLAQGSCGSTFMGYSTYFYRQAGLPTEGSFDLSLAQYALGIIGTIGSWFLMSYAGRRSIYLYGTMVLFCLLMIIGLMSVASADSQSVKWVIGSTLLIFTLVYDFTVGPVCYALVSEVSSTRLKAKTIVLARNLYNIGGVVNNIFITYQLTPQPNGWGWGANSAFFWAATCGLCVIWVYFRLPEPKGRTYGEMDILFERGVPARKFQSTRLDIICSNQMTVIPSPHEGGRIDSTIHNPIPT